MRPDNQANLSKHFIHQGKAGFTLLAFVLAQPAWAPPCFAQDTLRAEPISQSAGLEDLEARLQSEKKQNPVADARPADGLEEKRQKRDLERFGIWSPQRSAELAEQFYTLEVPKRFKELGFTETPSPSYWYFPMRPEHQVRILQHLLEMIRYPQRSRNFFKGLGATWRDSKGVSSWMKAQRETLPEERERDLFSLVQQADTLEDRWRLLILRVPPVAEDDLDFIYTFAYQAQKLSEVQWKKWLINVRRTVQGFSRKQYALVQWDLGNRFPNREGFVFLHVTDHLPRSNIWVVREGTYFTWESRVLGQGLFRIGGDYMIVAKVPFSRVEIAGWLAPNGESEVAISRGPIEILGVAPWDVEHVPSFNFFNIWGLPDREEEIPKEKVWTYRGNKRPDWVKTFLKRLRTANRTRRKLEGLLQYVSRIMGPQYVEFAHLDWRSVPPPDWREDLLHAGVSYLLFLAEESYFFGLFDVPESFQEGLDRFEQIRKNPQSVEKEKTKQRTLRKVSSTIIRELNRLKQEISLSAAGLEETMDIRLEGLAGAVPEKRVLVINTWVVEQKDWLEELMRRIPADLKSKVLLFGKSFEAQQLADHYGIPMVVSDEVQDLAFELIRWPEEGDLRVSYLGDPMTAKLLRQMLPPSIEATPIDPEVGLRELFLVLGVPEVVLDAVRAEELEGVLARERAA